MTAWRALADWRRDAQRVRSSETGAMPPPDAALLPGTCGLCGATGGFACGAGLRDPREGLRCLACGCNARQRAAAAAALSALPAPRAAKVYITEQASPLFLVLRGAVGNLAGSEYPSGFWKRLRLSVWLWRHGVPAWVDRQDVTALGFADARFDCLVSLDVLEHVPDHRAALREFSRILAPGGRLVLTVPFYEGAAATATIAHLRGDGTVEFDGAPEYHGDPLGGGVPCFHHFGWDLLQDLHETGFVEAEACRMRDRAAGLPQGVWVIRATR